MATTIPNRWENESLFKYIIRLMDAFPNWGIRKVKEYAKGTKRIRCGKYQPHYGEQAAARNRLHRANGTHGL